MNGSNVAETLREALARKAWSTLVARAAISGWQLWRSDPADGVQRFFAGRFGTVIVLADTDEVGRFLDRCAA
jgi:hypothetical protein